MTYKTIKEIVLEVEKKQKLCSFEDFKELDERKIYNITEWYEPRKLCFNFTVVKHIPTNKFYRFKKDIYTGITYFHGEVESKQVIKNEWVIKNNID